MSNISLVPNPATSRNYVIFPAAPFVLSSLAMSIVPTHKSFSALALGVSAPLVFGVDYFPAFLFNRATAELGKPVYAGISLADPALSGVVTYSFTGVGSGYQATTLQISNIYDNDAIDPLVAYWDDVVVGLPLFPHTPLTYNADTLVGIDTINSQIQTLQDQVADSALAVSDIDFSAHVSDMNNPHVTTAEHLGLGNIPNWTTADATLVIAGGSSHEFVTPLAVKDSVGHVVPNATVIQRGKVALNQGESAGDPTNSTDGLTAAGLVYMLQNNLIDSGANLTDSQRQQVVFSPFPIVYPATWDGVICNNFEDLVHAVETATGISPLTANAADGSIYFPRTASAPDLTLS